MTTARRVINTPEAPAPSLPYSQAVRAGDFLFLAGQVATDFQTGIAPEARGDPRRPNHASDGRLQAEYILQNIRHVMEAAGSSLRNVIHFEAFFTGRDQVRPVIAVRNRHLGAAVPCGTHIRAGSPPVPEALFTFEVVGLAPGPGSDLRVELVRPADWPSPTHGFAVAVRTGDLVWTGGSAATDFTSDAPWPGAVGTAVAREARTNPNFWYDSEIVSQTRFSLRKLKIFLEAAGTSFEHVVKATVYLLDAADYWGFEEVWLETFPTDPPALTVLPMDDFGPIGCRVEVRLVAVIPGGRLSKEVVRTDLAPAPLGHYSQAVRAGNLLFLSGQLACDANGVAPEARVNPALPYFTSSAKNQLEVILRNTRAICEAGGTSLENIARGHLHFANPGDVYPAFEVWQEAFPSERPAATVLLTEKPFVVPDCTISADWIAHVPG
ncbi:MAG: hypothetical protein IT307_16595 [Chloroflexi bacterium]|nr:hypothetical protein [Chloroflexota bacterium]